jgi:hypothetical protein
VNVLPAIVTVPVRAGPLFAATEYETVPLPVPLAPAVTVIHAALLAAVQGHVPAEAVTLTVPVDAVAAGLTEVGEIVYVQPFAWLIVKVLVPIVIVPLRAGPTFAATEYETVPLPFPVAPPVTVIHAALLVDVQVQPVVEVTLTLPVDAVAVTLAEGADNVCAQPLA